jgi:hypothetical protein
VTSSKPGRGRRSWSMIAQRSVFSCTWKHQRKGSASFQRRSAAPYCYFKALLRAFPHAVRQSACIKRIIGGCRGADSLPLAQENGSPAAALPLRCSGRMTCCLRPGLACPPCQAR